MGNILHNIRICTRSFGHFCAAVDPGNPKHHITSAVFENRSDAEAFAAQAEGKPVHAPSWTGAHWTAWGRQVGMA